MTQSNGKDVVGVIGVGHMGSALAISLMRAGFPLLAYDVRESAVDGLVAKGAERAKSIEELASRVDVVSVVVLNDEQLRDVVSIVLEHARPGVPIVVHSTVLPTTLTALAGLAGERGHALIEAPITGGVEKAEIGTLTVLIGGDEAPVRRCWPLFEAIGSNLFHVGPVGAGAAAKIVNNLISIGSYGLQLEAMSIASAYGIDEETMTTILAVGQGDSRGIRTWGRMDRVRAGYLAEGMPNVYLKVTKDLREAAIAGGLRELVLPLTSVVAKAMPEVLRQRDDELGRQPRPNIPRCATCHQELAAPFREIGTHPECR